MTPVRRMAEVFSNLSKFRDALTFAVPILLSADMIYNYYYVSKLWRERCAEWRAEEEAELHSAISTVCRRVVTACGKLEDQTWAIAMRKLQHIASDPHLAPTPERSKPPDEEWDFLASMGLLSR